MATNKNSKNKIFKIQNGKRRRVRTEIIKQEIDQVKVTIKNKEEIEEFSKNFKNIIELDEREMRYETNKLLHNLRMKKKELKQMK